MHTSTAPASWITAFLRPSGQRCEGYWPKSQIEALQYILNVVPRRRSEWSSKEDVLRKVRAVERYLVAKNSVRRLRGLARSRIDGQWLGNQEFVDTHPESGATVCWPQLYVAHYIGQYNIPPTQYFFDYVQERFKRLT